MAVKHKDYEMEQKRLDETIAVIEREIKMLCEDIREATDDYVKQAVNYAKAKTLRYLEDHGRAKPYFGRVDFLRDEVYELDTVYIGKRGIVRSDTFESVVVDWRAPIASLYYSGESKDASYRMGREIVRGEVKLKRNFAIENGRITGIYDGALKETIDREMGDPDEFLQEGFIDEFLAANLNQTNVGRLKDIVATIQSEQNDIIRAEKDRPVIVQGVAGSGKTTIALHRLSYLIYNNQDTLLSKKFMVFAPNRMFLNYISEVLPELGVDDVQQSTYADWAARLVKPLLPKGWRITSPDKPLQLFFEAGRPERERQAVVNRLRFKGSLAFRDALETYMRQLMEKRIPFKDLRFVYSRTKHAFSLDGDVFKRLFFDQLAHLPYQRRRDALRKHAKQEMNKQFYAHLRQLKVDLDKSSMARYEKMLEKVLNAYMDSFPQLDVFEAYRELLTDKVLLRELVSPAVDDEVIEDVCASSAALFAEQRLELEDVAPLLYLQHLVEGMAAEGQFDHAVVDEAQDLSALEIAVIALAARHNSLTVVGDLAQAIHPYRGIHAWEELTEGIFPEPRADFYTLSQSYRSTIEIMRCANEILRQIALPEAVLAKPVLRHGAKPVLVTRESRQALWQEVAEQVRRYREAGFSSIAIVSKTIRDSKLAFKILKEQIEVLALLGNRDREFPGGVCVMPAFLTKGLQFDAVILLDIDQYQQDEWDAKLLYVAMTRPVHRLMLTRKEGCHSPLFDAVSSDLYEKR